MPTLSEQFHTIACKLTALNASRKEIFMKVVYKFKELFSNKPGCAKGYVHKIKLIKSNPTINRTYPVPFALRDAVSKCICEMVDSGVIERAVSPYCNPLRVTGKSDGSVRICLDARLLNQYIEDDHESPPVISELLQKFFQCNFFSKIDLTQGYWQIPLDVNSRPYTAFLFGTSMYQFTRVPFGLKTAGSAFIRALNIAFETKINVINLNEIIGYENVESEDENEIIDSDNFGKQISTYIDDTAIATRTFLGHIKVIVIVFLKLVINNFTIRLEKCEFFQNQVMFLEVVLSFDGITPDPDRIKEIQRRT